MVHELDTDYLIIGAGAMGLAFADELVTQSPDVRIILVDRRAKPGGHWVDSYRFVTLHQPAAYYGVNSRRLERAVRLALGVDESLLVVACRPPVAGDHRLRQVMQCAHQEVA